MSEGEYGETFHNLPIKAFYPPDKEQIDDITPLFNWSHTKNISNYHIRISDTKDFSGTFFTNDMTLTKTKFPSPTYFNNDKPYYWRIRVRKINGDWLPWGDTWSFSVTFYNIFKHLYNTTPLLDWEAIENCKAYHLQLSTDSHFSNNFIVDNNTLTTTQYQVETTLETFTNYYYRLRVKNQEGNWLNWSDAWIFFLVTESKFKASDGSSYEYFGSSLSIVL